MNVRPSAARLSERRGYSLVELMVSLSAAVVLMAGMASAVMVSSRSLTLNDTGVGQRAVSTDVQRDLFTDLQRATGFTERTATAVTFTVPDRTGDGRPETLRYAWSGVAGAPLTMQMNGGTAQNVATNVQQFALSYRTNAVTAPVVPDEAPPTSGRLLFVSGGTYTPPTLLQALAGQSGTLTLTSTEGPKATLFNSWGFTVNLIGASQSNSDFTTALGENDVVFVSSEPGTTSRASTLKSAAIGVVNENPAIAATLGFYTGTGNTSGTNVMIGAANHYIATGYTALQSVPVLSASGTLHAFPSPKAASMSIIGINPSGNKVNFATIAAGRLDVAGATVPARRVQLPWASASFNSSALTTDGQNLLKAALLWGVGNGGSGDPSLATIGPTTSSTANYHTTKSTRMEASRVTLATNGELLELSAYVKSSSLPLRLAIYADNAGVPGARLAQTSQLAGVSTDSWITGTVTPTFLSPGTYWLAVSLSNDTQRTYYAATTGVTTSEITNTTFASGFPATWTPGSGGTTNTYANTQLLIYGSYIAQP